MVRAAERAQRRSLWVVLDWDVVQIEGAVLETWLPAVINGLDELARLAPAAPGRARCPPSAWSGTSEAQRAPWQTNAKASIPKPAT